jgi:hypothetical protein
MLTNISVQFHDYTCRSDTFWADLEVENCKFFTILLSQGTILFWNICLLSVWIYKIKWNLNYFWISVNVGIIYCIKWSSNLLFSSHDQDLSVNLMEFCSKETEKLQLKYCFTAFKYNKKIIYKHTYIKNIYWLGYFFLYFT